MIVENCIIQNNMYNSDVRLFKLHLSSTRHIEFNSNILCSIKYRKQGT